MKSKKQEGSKIPKKKSERPSLSWTRMDAREQKYFNSLITFFKGGYGSVAEIIKQLEKLDTGKLDIDKYVGKGGRF
ncbi:MAG: hypothetical protein Q8O88_00765 [bacterium]|nr:hypothetical protein [bacterium]